MKGLKMARLEYEVTINGADNGLIVRIGCKTLVFLDGNIKEFIDDFTTYLQGGYDGYKAMHTKYFPESPEVAMNRGGTSVAPEIPAALAGR